MTALARRTRIVHVVYSFAIGGLENVIVQLISRLPADQFGGNGQSIRVIVFKLSAGHTC